MFNYLKTENHKRIKSCCFIGESKLDNEQQNTLNFFLDILININVYNFLFFSNSLFEQDCYNTVDTFSKQSLNIRKIGFIFNNTKTRKLFNEIYYQCKDNGKILKLEQCTNIINQCDFCFISKCDLVNKNNVFYKVYLYTQIKNVKVIII